MFRPMTSVSAADPVTSTGGSLVMDMTDEPEEM
jgi:hypothetical protein